MENSSYLFDQLTRKRSRTNSSSMDDDMEEEEESGFHGNNNRSPGSQGSSGWEVDQGTVQPNIVLRCIKLPMLGLDY